MSTDGPAPTATGHEWRCCGCRWKGETLVAAKGHLLEEEKSILPHYPFEAPRAESGPLSKVATRVMLPAGGRAEVLTYAAARRRLYQRLDKIGPAAGRRRG